MKTFKRIAVSLFLLLLPAVTASADIFYAASNYSSGLAGTVVRQGSLFTVYDKPYAGLNGDAAGFTFRDHNGESRAFTRERVAGKDDTVRVFDPADLSKPITTSPSWRAANIHAAASIGDYLYVTTYESYADSAVENTGKVVRIDMADGYKADKGYHYERQGSVNPHGEALHIEGDESGYKVYALFGLSTSLALKYEPTEIVEFDEELNVLRKAKLESGAKKGLNAMRMAYRGGKLYVACMGGYQGPDSWGDVWEVDLKTMTPRQVLDGKSLTYKVNGQDVAIGMYGVQFAPDGTAYLLTGSYSADYNFRGRLYVTTAAALAKGNAGVLRAEYSAKEGYSGFSWDILYDRGSGVLWCMVGKSLEARNPDGSLIKKLTPGALGDNIYSIAEILTDTDEEETPERPSLVQVTVPQEKPEWVEAVQEGKMDFAELEDLKKINNGALESIIDEDEEKGVTVVSVGAAFSLAKELYGDESDPQVRPQPAFKAEVGSGRVAAVGLRVKGPDFLANNAKSVKVMKVKGAGDTDTRKFTYVLEASEYDDGTFTILKEDGTPAGDLSGDGTYILTLFVKDGGEYDLDGSENGSVIDPSVIVGVTGSSAEVPESPSTESGGDAGGGGCSSGIPVTVLLAGLFGLASAWTIRRPRRR
ncbi:MAG: hypothetical protein LBS75_09750 [Synergistaceae bacterium]|nr:hypothetical protein [Synergistaceae bacterium]